MGPFMASPPKGPGTKGAPVSGQALAVSAVCQQNHLGPPRASVSLSIKHFDKQVLLRMAEVTARLVAVRML